MGYQVQTNVTYWVWVGTKLIQQLEGLQDPGPSFYPEKSCYEILPFNNDFLQLASILSFKNKQ